MKTYREIFKKSKVLSLAIQEQWAVAEIQPLIYITMNKDEYTSSERVGMSERMQDMFSQVNIDTIEKLANFNENSLREKCYLMGDGICAFLRDAFADFDKHEKARKVFMKAIMPNYDQFFRDKPVTNSR